MKKFLFFLCLLSFACSNHKQYEKAENGLDAGREFLNAVSAGDFARAKFYMLQDEKNLASLKTAEESYRMLDKEGRQQTRAASILVSEVEEPDPSTTLIHYTLSNETKPRVLKVIKQNGNWLVAFDNS